MQVGQKLLDFRPANRMQMAQAVKTDKARRPLHITIFSARRVLTHATSTANTVEQARRFGTGQFADGQAQNVVVEKREGGVSLFQTVQRILFRLGNVFEETPDLAGRQIAGMAFVEKEDQPFRPESVAFTWPLLAKARPRKLTNKIEESRRIRRRRHKTAAERGK
jgi:hypothetical protein